MWRKKNPFAVLVGMQTGAATVENSMEIPQKIKNISAFWPSDPTSGNIYEGTQNTNLEEHKHPYVLWIVVYFRQDVGAAQMCIILSEIASQEKTNTIWSHLLVELNQQNKQAK